MLPLNKAWAEQRGMFLEKGKADIFWQQGGDWEGLSKMVNSCCHRHLRNCLGFPIILLLVKSVASLCFCLCSGKSEVTR